MAYTLTGGSNPDNEPENTIGEFWSRSYSGRFRVFFDDGVKLGQADLDNDSTEQRDLLRAVPGPARDQTWEAMFDGYRHATEKVRGPIFHIGD